MLPLVVECWSRDPIFLRSNFHSLIVYIRDNLLFVIIFPRYLPGLHKLHGELVDDVSCFSLLRPPSRIIKVLMKTSMNIYPFVPSKLHFASALPLLWQCSFLLRRDLKRGRLAKFYQYLIRRPDAAQSNRAFLETKVTRPRRRRFTLHDLRVTILQIISFHLFVLIVMRRKLYRALYVEVIPRCTRV